MPMEEADSGIMWVHRVGTTQGRGPPSGNEAAALGMLTVSHFQDKARWGER